MSKERNFRQHVADYYDGIDDNGNVDHKALIERMGLHAFTAEDVAKLGEHRIRAFISEKLGEAEEDYHGTTIDDETKKRIRPVPEHVTEHHNRMVDELYAELTPPEPQVKRRPPAFKRRSAA